MEAEILKSFTVQEKIGEGGCAKVYLALDNKTEQQVAIKIVPKEPNDDEEFIKNEVELVKQLNHPNICKIYDVIETYTSFYIIMEYCSNGTLIDYLSKNGPMDEEHALRIFVQIVDVMKYLHKEMQIVHRDLKLENIMFDSNYNIKIIDFGFSRSLSGDALLRTQCGSILYCAPEVIKGIKYSYSVDIWSAGVILYVLVAGHFPFDSQNITQLAQRILYSDFDCPKKFSTQFEDIIRLMLEKYPDDRIDIDKVIEHPWVNEEYMTLKAIYSNECPSSRSAHCFDDFALSARSNPIIRKPTPQNAIIRITQPVTKRSRRVSTRQARYSF